MDNDDYSAERHCRQNFIRPSSSSMFRAPSWNPGFGANSSDEVDEDDHEDQNGTDPYSGEQANTSNSVSTKTSDEDDISQADPEILKQIKLGLEFEIPTVYLKRSDSSTSSFHVYQVHIKSGSNAQWSIYKRYSQFLAFHHQLRQVLPKVKDVPFPPKKRLNSKASTIVQDRRRKLEEYVQRVSDLIARLPIALIDLESFQKLYKLSSDNSSTSSSPFSSAQQVTGESIEAVSINESLHSEQDQERDGVAQERETKATADKMPVTSARCLFYEFIAPDSTQEQTTV